MKTKIFFFLFSIILFYSCNSESKSYPSIEGESGTYSEETALNMDASENQKLEKKTKSAISDQTSNTSTENEEKIEPKIIKNASISFGVNSYKKSKPKIENIVKKYKGNIANESEINNSYSISNTITIRVPAENFDSLLSAMEGEAEKFESKSINTDDVTEEYIDVTKRLDNKKKVEAQYIELLKKARTISEILEVNEPIRVLREEIESKEGRLRYLNNQVGMSTITLYIHQDYDTVSYGFFHKIIEAISGGWNGFLMFIIGIIYVWPLILIVCILFFIIKRSIKKRKNKKLETKI